MKSNRINSLVVLGAAAVAFGTDTLHAQTAWDGGASTSDYATALNWAGDIIPGNGNTNGALIGGGATHTVVYSTAASYTSTGTGKANSLLVGTGTSGVGSLTLNGSAGTLTFGGDVYTNAAYIGAGTGATGTVTVSAGKLAIVGGIDASINLGVTIAGLTAESGTLLINGGTVEVAGRILMGANSTLNTGNLTLSSGLLDMKRTSTTLVAENGTIQLGNGTNTVNLDGGTAILSGFHVTAAANARSNIYFNGTTLKANIASTDFINGTPTNVGLRLKNGGLVFDTNGFAVTINDAMAEESGHTAILRKEGSGTLTISGAQTRSGTTTVNGGTLHVSGTGSLGTGATTVSGSGSILNLDRNDTWGAAGLSLQALTIQAGGLVTNGTQVNRGFNEIQTLALNGGELRATGTARAGAQGDLFQFEAYAIRNSVTVSGSTASSITNPSALANAGINIGGTTNLGGGVGASLTFNVADVTGSPAADLTVSAVLKNTHALSNGLIKTGAGTMELSAVNRYTGATTVSAGVLAVNGSLANTSTTVGATGTLQGTGTIGGPVAIQNGGTLAPGNSIESLGLGAVSFLAGSTLAFELQTNLYAGAPGTAADLIHSSGTLDIVPGAFLTLTDLATSMALANGSKLTLISYLGGWTSGELFTYNGTTLADDSTFTLGANQWRFDYNDISGGPNFSSDQVLATNFVTMTVVPEPSAALLVGLGALALLRRRRR